MGRSLLRKDGVELMLRPLVAVALALSVMRAMAQETVPGDRVYYLHSGTQESCPPLNWHIVASPDGVLSGVVVSDDKKLVVTLAGVINPQVNVERDAKQSSTAENRTFEMMASEVGGGNRIAEVKGIIEPNGWLSATVNGYGVACQHMRVPLFVPATR